MDIAMRMNRPTLAAALATVILLSGCQKDEEQAAPAFPPSAVAVFTTASETLPITNELPGRITATRVAEVRPRVSGIVVERVFQQGSKVKEGDVLYRIDPAPFQVQVEKAEATLRRAQAVHLQAEQKAARQEALKKANVVAAQQFDDANGLLAAANADVAIAQAGLAAAKLDLQYANVTAPISGQIGRALITEGALVSANSSENLATIQQLDPLYADFTQSATDLIRLRKALEAGQMMSGDQEAEVQLILDDGTPYEHKGKLLFSEAAVDATTGQVTLRGEFPNPDGDLLPGMYVRVLVQQGVEKDAITVPQQAVQRNNAGQSQVYVVAADKKVEFRNVTLGRTVGTRWQVASGLKPGEKVIVEGFQKIGPGAPVEPTDWDPNAKPAAEAAQTTAATDAKPAEATE
ncbi:MULTISPECIES: efflux RND transporter periplasmic adaptor subunit [Ensifer]|jgi:membrane fusion protein (multidrug efflux system)|uniref:Efflux RND transporter periplasmic adaptor subunit n=1 Tax=Ensifer canadensis TaxID=555315 RepID=A0AAW4FFG4_9HYPH|nr:MULTISPECIES: efflux RND transporter periplasmic adaptor subunit [Ensifer]AHK42984.1 putative efflux transporter, RND family, MFP subunit [Ensifer adhaerens OV14]KQU98524.1 RND transporter [Ensifer sp. Root31]KQW63284.1 RND transporter [Ensifer sp. Root1252]KQW85298.1 RND transporter [Ensifer sp. Root127]KQY75690.1 RND transporter [Ensifer sp. Root142]KRC84104.1 RND transporter [Ensifer sp. Root231]KRD04459.1 RND transporter [Ensifer sp. Root258]OMQ43391.1 efflux transporter periplasmic 